MKSNSLLKYQLEQARTSEDQEPTLESQHRRALSDAKWTERNRCVELLTHGLETNRNLWEVLADMKADSAAPAEASVSATSTPAAQPLAQPAGAADFGDEVWACFQAQRQGASQW